MKYENSTVKEIKLWTSLIIFFIGVALGYASIFYIDNIETVKIILWFIGILTFFGFLAIQAVRD